MKTMNYVLAAVTLIGFAPLCALGAEAEKPMIEFSPVIDANGVVIDWIAEQGKETLALDGTERGYRVNNPDGTATLFTIQEVQDGKAILVRLIVKSGPPLRTVLPEGLVFDVPSGTTVRFYFTLNLLGLVGGAPSSNSNRDIYINRSVTGYVDLLVEVGGPVGVNDANDGTFRTVPIGERVHFDVRNFYLPRYYRGYEAHRTDPSRLGKVFSGKEDDSDDDDDDGDDDDDDGPPVVTPPGP